MDINNVDWTSYKQAIKAIKKDGVLIANVPKEIIDKKMVLTAIKNNKGDLGFGPLTYIPSEVIDESVALEILKSKSIAYDWQLLSYEQKALIGKLSKKELYNAIERYPGILHFAATEENIYYKEFLKDKKLAETILKSDSSQVWMIALFDTQIRKQVLQNKDKDFILNIMRNEKMSKMKYIPDIYSSLKPNMQKDPEIINEMLKIHPSMINNMHIDIRDNKEYMKLAINNGAVPNVIPVELYEDIDLVTKMMQIKDIYDQVPEKIKLNKEIALIHANNCKNLSPQSTKIPQEVYDDRDFILDLLDIEESRGTIKGPSCLQYSKCTYDPEDFSLAVAHASFFDDVSPEKTGLPLEVYDNKQFIDDMLAIQHYECLKYSKYGKDKDFIINHAKTNPECLTYVDSNAIFSSLKETYDFFKNYANDEQYNNCIPSKYKEKVETLLKANDVYELAKVDFSHFNKEFCNLAREIQHNKLSEMKLSSTSMKEEMELVDNLLDNRYNSLLEQKNQELSDGFHEFLEENKRSRR